MENAKFIRLYEGKESITSDRTAVFFPLPKKDEYYQDVIALTSEKEREPLVYTVGKRVLPAGGKLPTSFQRWTIIYIVHGMLCTETEEMQEGTFIAMPPSCAQTFLSKTNSTFYWCSTNDIWLTRLIIECGFRGDCICFGHLKPNPMLVEIFEQTIYRFPCQSEHHRIYLTGQFARLFSLLFSASTDLVSITADPIFNRCLRRIDAMSGNVTVEYLANHYFVSRRHLYELFRKYKNVSPVDYILEVRMREADRYLTGTDYSIARIAELIGYSDYTHFSRAYTKFYGRSPSQRRKEWKETLG